MASDRRWVKPSSLYVVATPIGNQSDWSTRAVETLQECDWIACEDTRTSGTLFEASGIKTPLLSYHDHNESERAGELCRRLAQGESGALVSDAGTPAVSDPGFRLVRACRKEGVDVYTVPGPSAVIAALSISGLPTDRFLFAGFLPPKSAARRRFLEEQKDASHTVILYESKHRIGKFLGEIEEVMGSGRVISLSRELSKLHESSFSGKVEDVRRRYEQGSQKGEFVVIIAAEGFEL